MVTIPEQDYLAHYGILRKSGRYPWGSGETQAERNQSFLGMVDELKKKGLSETEVAKGLGITTTQLRDARSLIRNERKQDEIHMAQRLKEKGMSNGAIAARMREAGFKVSGESQVRALLNPSQERKAKVLDSVSDSLRKAVDEKEFLDVGAGTEHQLNITSTKLRTALQKLKEEGYVVHEVKVQQLGTKNQTNMRVLAKPGTTWGDVQKNRHNIRQYVDYSNDGGMTVLGMKPPLSLDLKRVGIRYAEQGGTDADGVMYVRDGVPDVSLGRSRYAQVRVMVNGTHYIKGMAIKVDPKELPDGVDVLFNTNKSDKGDKLKALKPLKRLRADGDDPSKPDEFTGPVDMDNPFGASIKKQIGEGVDPKTLKPMKLTSVMNIVNDEGDWDKWSKSLSTQMLSKQRPALAKEQLDKTYSDKKTELDGILALTNPSVRKKLLEAYADGADSSAVHLKAAAMPRQKTQVLMPVKDMRPDEVYAPNFKNGEKVVLIRFPHGGTFEIPELTVNNKTPAAVKLLGDSKDAIGIHPKVAERLSGADFDGDTVLTIPNGLGKIKTSPALQGLKNFDAKTEYPPYEGMKRMTAHEKGMQMGLVSNLITDMTIGGANTDELARAVKHSMVVIDAEKHNLDFRRSAQDNGISALMKKYQKSSQGGASTLISKATSPEKVPERKLRSAAKGGPIDPATGKLVYEYTGRSKKWTDDNGKEHSREVKTETTKLANTDDAHTLSSGTVIEKVYADHSNRLKNLANQARKELVTVKPRPYDKSARVAYKAQVDTLLSKVAVAEKNAPRERQAQVFATATVRKKVEANPDLLLKENKAELKRVKSQALAAARLRTQADKAKFEVTEEEWAAIQAGAVTAHKLDQILTYADLDRIKELATPKAKDVMPAAKVARAKALMSKGYTRAEVAEALGVSVSTVMRELGGEED